MAAITDAERLAFFESIRIPEEKFRNIVELRMAQFKPILANLRRSVEELRGVLRGLEDAEKAGLDAQRRRDPAISSLGDEAAQREMNRSNRALRSVFACLLRKSVRAVQAAIEVTKGPLEACEEKLHECEGQDVFGGSDVPFIAFAVQAILEENEVEGVTWNGAYAMYALGYYQLPPQPGGQSGDPVVNKFTTNRSRGKVKFEQIKRSLQGIQE